MENINIDSNNKNSQPTSKYSIISTSTDISIPGVEISKDNKLIPTNSFYNSNIFTLNIDSSLLEMPSKFFYRKKGNTHQFFGNSNGDPLIIIGPQWFFIICLTSFISFLFIIAIRGLWNNISYYIKILGFFVYFLFLFSYLYTALINPGFPKNDDDSRNGEPRSKFRYCDTCKIFVNMDKKTFHCVDCDICVEGFDHHCPWTGKCIGKNNYKSFSVFVCSVFTFIVYFFIAIANIQFDK